MSNDWNGENRRNNDRNQHDTLIRIDVNLSNFMKRFDEHVKNDKEDFDRLYLATSSLKSFMNKTLGGMVVLMALGTLAYIVKLLSHA